MIKPESRIIHDSVTVDKECIRLDFDNTIVTGYFNCGMSKIVSLVGSPIKVGESFDCAYTNVSSLLGCPRDIGGMVYIHNTLIESLEHIHKMIDRIYGFLTVHNKPYTNVLGLLNIRDLQGVTIQMYRGTHKPEVYNMWGIINKYLSNTPNPRDRNIQRCQEELIEAGFAEYAML